MSWTDERIEKLTKMWEGGSTASQIAEELGGVSRNAVIGKAHRLGLKARPSPVKANEKVEAPAAPPVAKPAKLAVPPSEPRATAPRQPVPVSYFICELNHGRLQQALTKMPARFSSLSGLVKGRSVPSLRST